MVCPLVRGDNLRALASGLSPVHGLNHGIHVEGSYTQVSADFVPLNVEIIHEL